MTFLYTQGDLLRRATAHVAACLQEQPTRSLMHILDETGMRFNLTPIDCQTLERLFTPEKSTQELQQQKDMYTAEHIATQDNKLGE